MFLLSLGWEPDREPARSDGGQAGRPHPAHERDRQRDLLVLSL
jgi:hypothetical protein